MLSTVAVVPLKAPDGAKSRLAESLELAERQELARWMATRTLSALRASGMIAQLAVVSPDETTLAWAREQGAIPIVQTAGDLNAGLALGRAWAEEQHADALLITLGDLPLLAPGEVAAFVALADNHKRLIALAPDDAGQGTNALLARPPALAPLAFGVGSLAHHQALARAAAVEPLLFPSPGFGFDVDTPEDVRRLRAMKLR